MSDAVILNILRVTDFEEKKNKAVILLSVIWTKHILTYYYSQFVQTLSVMLN